MKAIASKLRVAALAVLFSVAANAQDASLVKLNPFTPKTNDVFTYHVSAMGNEYDFIVTIVSFRPDLSFMWRMEGDVNQKGAITIPAAMVEGGIGLLNYFKSEAITLTKQTSVWVSNRIYKLLKAGKEADVIFDNDTQAQKLKPIGNENYSFAMNGVETEAGVIKADNQKSFFDKKEIRVLDDANNPLIVYMNFGWTIKLTSITQQ